MIKGDRFIDGKEAIIIGRANPSEIAIVFCDDEGRSLFLSSVLTHADFDIIAIIV